MHFSPQIKSRSSSKNARFFKVNKRHAAAGIEGAKLHLGFKKGH